MQASAPIGIFDSGTGGLTVARAVRELLPHERIVYFGDLAHLPYGDKSTAAIQAYSVKICDVLLQQGCKVILIACNSASAAAFELVKAYVGSRAKVMNVIDPLVDYLRENMAERRIGLIGTKQTVSSNVYASKIDALKKGITLQSLATPLLVPMIEEGFIHNRVSQDIIDEYLSNAVLADIEALILGCTHYPLIKEEIRSYYKGGVEVLDSATIVAASLKALLEHHHLLNKGEEGGRDRFLVSDHTDAFEASTRLFFGQAIQLEKYPLWE